MRNTGEGLGLTGRALDYFTYACNEVQLTLSVDRKTGTAHIIKVDGREVKGSA